MAVFPRAGAAFVLCAPSGTGKTTLAAKLLRTFTRLTFSISYTTREPRAGETDGREYFFINKSEFLRLAEEEYFAEWAEVHGHYYGTPLQTARKLLAAGSDVLFDVDVQGAKQLAKAFPEAFFAFLLPPSCAELERRLRIRETEQESSIALRLFNAVNELKEAEWFDAWIINDDIDKSFADICSAYRSACLNPQLRAGFLSQLLKQF
ncbi:MAG: guanylate kinase [Deltaproteobacteria bacterium]|jgi:guanylate kinase|nr:guanylate kinase [Deltaproteobacteria bacterium]